MQIKNGLDDCACCSSNGSDTHRRFVKREFGQWERISFSPEASIYCLFWKEKSK